MNKFENFLKTLGDEGIESLITTLKNMSVKQVVCDVKEAYTKENLSTKDRASLVQICKQMGQKVSGKKDELIERILNPVAKTAPVRKTSPSTEKKSPKTKKAPVKKDDIPEKILKKIESNPVSFRRSKFGNYIHPETKMVINKETKTVIGREDEEGKVVALNDEDIEICNKYKMTYEIPDNLDVNTKKKTKEEVVKDDIDEKDLLEDIPDEIDESEVEDDE